MEEKMTEAKGVLVHAEVAEGELAAITTELLGCGRKLADDLGEELSALIMGSGVGGLAAEAIAFGADRAYVLEDPLWQSYYLDAYLPAVEKAIRQATPRILLLGQTSVGLDLAPRLAFRLGTVATLDCIELAIDTEVKRLQLTKPVYGGNARAVFTSEYDPQIATVRAKTMSPPDRDPARQGEVFTIEAEIDQAALRTRLLEKVAQQVGGVRLEAAEVVVGGGRGIGSAEGLQQLQELAGLLRGAVGASRPACDNGWVPDVRQIGLTGKIVAPELYLAIALSGASQHMAGCSGCKNIVAINKDPEANIFREARFGVVGDWKKVLPAFTAKVRELLAG
jgi:electron transfer flavoprotein alpha subunit